MAIPNIVPRNNNDGETLGTHAKQFSNVHTKDVTVNDVSLVTKLASIDSSLSSNTSAIATNTSNIATLSSGKVNKSNTTSFTISAGDKSIVGGSNGTLTWGNNHIDFVIEKVSASNCTVPANSNSYIGISTYKAGYKAIGILAMDCNSGGSAQNYINYWSWRILDAGTSNEKVSLSTRNMYSSDAVVSPVVTVIYQHT